jgi:hypothetical protein
MAGWPTPKRRAGYKAERATNSAAADMDDEHSYVVSKRCVAEATDGWTPSFFGVHSPPYLQTPSGIEQLLSCVLPASVKARKKETCWARAGKASSAPLGGGAGAHLTTSGPEAGVYVVLVQCTLALYSGRRLHRSSCIKHSYFREPFSHISLLGPVPARGGFPVSTGVIFFEGNDLLNIWSRCC